MASSSYYLILRYADLGVGYRHFKPRGVRNVASIESEGELIKISLHILTADLVIDSMEYTLAEIAPKAFYAVGIGVAINVLFSTMVNNLSLIEFTD